LFLILSFVMSQIQHSKPIRSFLLLPLVGLLFSACSDPEVVSYNVPKEERSEPSGPPPIVRASGEMAEATPMSPAPSGGGDPAMGMTILPGMERSADGAGTLEWDALPETWAEFAPSGIRIANFRIANDGGQAELTVLAFPGDVGGDLANVNRWRQQIGLSPLSAERLASETERIEVDGRDSLFVLMHGQRESVVGSFVPTGSHTWFFKMQGAKGAVSLEEKAFRDFMGTIRIR
jgi:hypothetical protein